MNLTITVETVLACVITLAGGWLVWQLLRQNGRILLRLEELEKRLDEFDFGEPAAPAGLPIGSAAPGFELPNLAGDVHTLTQYRGQALLLLFFNPVCSFCRELAPKLKEKAESEKQRAENQQRVLLIVSTGDAATNRTLFSRHKVDCPVLLQKDTEVAAAYQANGTPSGYLIGADGKIASEITIGGDPLLDLLDQLAENRERKAELGGNGGGGESRFSNRSLARSKIKRDGLKAGTVAPEFRLPRLDGHGELALSDLGGRPVFLVFSSPGCGPCNTLAPQLEKFHREHPELELVMISKGEPKENRAKVKEHRLSFPVVLQQQWETSRQYAMFATPVAYLIDEDGVVTADVAVGVDPILDLLTKAGHRATTVLSS
jgi:peroxiredoxin